jgi:4-hydroxybenzoate polyprenyltransferase
MLAPDLESTGESTFHGLIYELRPWQWYKQLILYVAVIFSGSAVELDAWIQTTLGAILFSAVAGGTYILNDVRDRAEDRKHPRKQHRPIASGQVSFRAAMACVITLYVSAGVLSWRLDRFFFGLVALYVGQNILYNFGAKEYLFVDLFGIGAGFVIRAVAGVVLVSVELSPWILLCTFLTALMLGFSKRWGEYQDVDNPAAVRSTLDDYSTQTLQFLIGSVATMLLMTYALYTFFAQDLAMMLTIPFAFYAVFRFVHLTFINNGASEPAALLLDQGLVTDFLLWGIVLIIVLYRNQLGVSL